MQQTGPAFTAPQDRLMQPDPALPSYATAASLTRLDLARQLAARCPHTLGAAIALTGSSARGLAEAGSDAEINHWVAQLPPPAVRADWLMEAGVTAVQAEPEPRSDDSEWFGGTYGGVFLETGWQTFDALETTLQPLLTGEAAEPERLRLAELLVSAVVLRPDERLTSLKDALTAFPEALRDRLIEQWSAPLTDEHRWAAAEKLARRGERLQVTQALTDSLKTAIRLCFVLNRRWEAGDKWMLTLAAHLPVMPPDWRTRLDAALSAPPVRAVPLARAWCDDALSLSSG
jgi:hypothetical protein